MFQKKGRAYKIGNSLIEIHNDVINNLLQWNTGQENRENRDLDYAFALSLLLSLIPVEEIAAGKIDDNAWNFMLSMFLTFFNVSIDVLIGQLRLFFFRCFTIASNE